MNEEIDDALRKYAERVQSFEDQLQKWNEVEVKRYLIEPLLTALLWDPADPNFVRHEFAVTMGSETKRIDYALMSGDAPICVVEAKAGEVDEVAARQALSYARSLDVPWALVTKSYCQMLWMRFFSAQQRRRFAGCLGLFISPASEARFEPVVHLASAGG